MTLQESIRTQATQQSNGSWTYEGKDAHAWRAEGQHLRRVAERDHAPHYHDYADEAYFIGEVLTDMDRSTLAQVAVLDVRRHTQACRKAFAEHDKAVRAFWQQYPLACRACEGEGGKGSTYDPSPAGVSLGSGFLWDFDPCPACEGHDTLPTCALCGQILAEEGTRLCTCPYDATPGGGPECLCWLEPLIV